MAIGMRLPFADQAIVHHDKIVGYLLDPDHPHGGDKARFFSAMGFRRDAPNVLREALLGLAWTAGAVALPHAFGTKYVLEGEVETPSGRRVWLRAVWMMDADRPPPRLVTAYPATRPVR